MIIIWWRLRLGYLVDRAMGESKNYIRVNESEKREVRESYKQMM